MYDKLIHTLDFRCFFFHVIYVHVLDIKFAQTSQFTKYWGAGEV